VTQSVKKTRIIYEGVETRYLTLYMGW
jgi:hypothetical protein